MNPPNIELGVKVGDVRTGSLGVVKSPVEVVISAPITVSAFDSTSKCHVYSVIASSPEASNVPEIFPSPLVSVISSSVDTAAGVVSSPI